MNSLHGRTHPVVAWMKKNLFSSPLDTCLSFFAFCLMLALVVPAVDWLFLDAQWRGTTPADCPDKNAACWPFIRARFDQFIYGFYPASERWRVNLGIGLGLLLTVPIFLPRMPWRGGWLLCLLLLVYPALGLGLFSGGVLGLAPVETGLWGGFFLTIVTAIFVLATSLPLALLLALGRESSFPLLRVCVTAWIEIWRSVPALVVLFVAIIMFPLFMPQGWEIDKFLRALIALTLLMSVYLGEAIRGAMLSIPTGQYEAARALGLNYWQSMRLVILPQVVPVALPQVTSTFIGLFKETTLLLIIGLFDLLGMVQLAAIDPQWLGPGVSATGYVFVALFFWVFCFSLSRYSAWLERQSSKVKRQGH